MKRLTIFILSIIIIIIYFIVNNITSTNNDNFKITKEKLIVSDVSPVIDLKYIKSDLSEIDVVSSDYLEADPIITYTSYDVHDNSGFKSYMYYTSITNKSSNQYFLQNNYAYTGDYGIRMVNGRYCIAVGSYFNCEIGQYLSLVLKNGTVIDCIMSDQKDDKHTDSNNIFTLSNGCMSEFIVSHELYKTAKLMGDISYVCDEWRSPVVEVRVYNDNVFN